MHYLRFSLVLACVTLLLVIASCGSAHKPHATLTDEHGHDHGHAEESQEVELAPYMGNLQRFSQKLGYAIEGRNAPLAAFYLTEITEALEEIQRDVPEHDGMPIAHTSEVIMMPLLPDVSRAIETQDWPAAQGAYALLIEGCNRCHAATEHGFIVITPAHGTPPFNQVFTAPAP